MILTDWANRRVSHGLGWPANTIIFLQQSSRKALFFPAGHAKHVQWVEREIRFDLLGAQKFEAVGADMFCTFWLPLNFQGYHSTQLVEGKWCWLATQDHAKLVYRCCGSSSGTVALCMKLRWETFFAKRTVSKILTSRDNDLSGVGKLIA